MENHFLNIPFSKILNHLLCLVLNQMYIKVKIKYDFMKQSCKLQIVANHKKNDTHVIQCLVIT